MSFTYDYPRPCVTTDCLIFRKIDSIWSLLLIERGNEPYKGCWALPGGFLEMEEDLETCAARELQEETGLTGISLHQLYAFGEPHRDPRHRTISIAFGVLTKHNGKPLAATMQLKPSGSPSMRCPAWPSTMS